MISFTFVAGLINSITNLLIPVFIGKYYHLALHTHSARGKLFDKILVHLHDVNLFFELFIGLILAKVLFTFLEKYLVGYSAEIFSRDLRDNLVETQLAFTFPAFQKKPVGKYLLRYSGDLLAIQRYVTHGIIKFSIDILFLVAAFIILSFINVQLTVFIFGAFPVFFVVVYFLNKYLQRITVKRRNIRSENLSFVSSRLHALLTVKVFNRERIEHQKFTRNSEKLFQYGKKYFLFYGLINSLFPFFLYALLAIVLVYAYRINLNDNVVIPPAELLIFIMVLINILPLLRRILQVNIVWQSGNVSISKILRIFNNKTERRDDNTSVKLEKGQIEIKNMDFAFHDRIALFNHFSAVILPHSITLLKGPQGSGKSTLFKIILGIYTPEHGEIKADGLDLLSMSMNNIRKNITMASDELPLMGKTLFEVVSYSRKEEKREQALRMLQELCFNIPGEKEINLDYKVEDGGKNLSAGQRKLLVIARAFLTRKKILLLDEPFKDLDETARNTVAEMLVKLKEKRTIIMTNQDDKVPVEVDHVIDLSW